MIAAAKKLNFAQFLNQRPEEGRYELVNGEIVPVEPIRAHKNVARHLVRCFDREIERLSLDYIVDKDIVIKTLTSAGVEQGRNPDVSVANASVWNNNALTYGALTEPLQLAVEVVSSNWEDDYVDKLAEYERLGIPEYWIVDYLAIASRTYLGYPKMPTVLIYQLIDGKYQVQKFQGSDASGNPSGERIISPTFPQLEINTEQIVAASQIHKI